MAALSLISLNIERDKHLELATPYLAESGADVVCLQELLESDIPKFTEALGAPCLFVPSTLYPAQNGLVAQGTGIFTRLPVVGREVRRYAGNEGELGEFVEAYDPKSNAQRQSNSISLVRVAKDGEEFSIATTHFPWTPDGQADDLQRAAVLNMLRVIEELGEMVLCGDFNAPRGGEIFSAIAEKLKDNVPEKYTSSLDGTIHRAGQLPYMVDGLFSTPGYSITDVEMVNGVSDHCALTSIISKV